MTETISLEAPAGQHVCDFDNVPGPVWEYPCQDFLRTDPSNPRKAIRFIGSWWACEDCHRLIQAEAWPLLLDRAAGWDPRARTELAGTWLQFRRHRTGEPVHGTPG